MSELCEKCGVEHCYRVKEPGESVKQCGAYKTTMAEKEKPEYIEREATLHRMKVDIAPPFKVVAEMPAADMAPVVHGSWSKFYKSGNKVEEGFVSSCCDMWNERRSHFCPNCGARMDGDG